MKVWALAFGTFACGGLLGALLFRGEPGPSVSGKQRLAASLFALPTAVDAVSAETPAIAQANFVEPETAPPKRLGNDVAASTPKEDAVRDVIDRELKDLTADEREIWFEELKGVPPGIVEDLLSVRRQFEGTKPRMPLGMKLDNEPSAAVPHLVEHPSLRPEWAVTIRAMRQARDIHLHNLANAQSPGYKRLVPLFASGAAPTDSAAQRDHQWGSRWQGVRLDVGAGAVVSTGRTLDVAINGSGWFSVRTPDGVAFTRNGHLVLDSERRLCISTSTGPLPLEPAVQAGDAFQDVVKFSQVQLAAIAGPSLLAYRADGLLHLEGHAPPRMLPSESSEVGPLAPKALERSNVDPDAEWREIERIDRWLDAVGR